ncbi:energy transducer TonB [Chryseolinea sp. T2]|uniref:energy transducer TonB n=1 Tax=Chryseolinea sp. T2 TaxID=3129255 RepID=UPI003077C160
MKPQGGSSSTMRYVQSNSTIALTEDSIYIRVDEQAQFPGGMEGLIQFLGKNVKYPAAARKARAEGTVFLAFVVYKDGSVGDASVIKGVSPELDGEALRIVRLFPAWIPGTVKGNAVSSRFVLPIKYKLGI